jgi:zinc protease
MTLIDRHPFGPRLVVEQHRLANGLEVLLVPDRAAPVVALNTWLRVGSRHERPGRTGIAHLFEHLMFNQTKRLAAGEFDRRIEALGADSNAATWVDWTHFTTNAPAAALPDVLELEAERMRHLVLEEAPLEAERQVVLNERRQRVDDDVEGFLAEELYRCAFTVHPYGHPTIGWQADIEAISVDDARAFYRTHYAPNNTTLVLVGSFAPDEALAHIERAYGGAPAADLARPAPVVEPPQTAERRACFAKPVLAGRALFAWKAPPQTHDDWIPLLVLNEICVGGPSARLYRQLVIEREVASTVQGMLAPFAEPGLWELFVSLARDTDVSVVEAVLDEAAERLRHEPPSAAELAKAQNRLETEHWATLETADGKAQALGHHHTTAGDHRRLFEVAERVERVTPDDLVRVAAAYLRREALTVVVAEPSGEDEPDDDDEEAAS